jgi:hypothetical protein
VGVVTANHIAKWNGSAWSAMGTGMDGDVYALAVSGTTLYAGGDFTRVGGVTANGIAKWDGSTWSALDTGMDNPVHALAVSGTDLYAGGDFQTAGGVWAYYIAKWNGSAWSALGSGMGGSFTSVHALAVSGTDLYAGGDFSTAGETTARNIAAWNGSAWSALGSGMDNPVYALAVSGRNLYAGGDFQTAGEATVNYIAVWNGGTWSALGSRMNSSVYALAASGTNLYAGGYFTKAGGLTANYIAAWNWKGRAWSALGAGMGGVYPSVYALAVSGTTLYAGGDFTTAGGVPANYIAAWNGSAWSALGSGMGGRSFSQTALGNVFAGPFVEALVPDASGHLFVGGGFTLAGTNVSPFIAQANLSGVPPGGVIQSIRVNGGTVTLNCQGISGSAYTVQRATNVLQWTQNLTTLLRTNAPPNGLFLCTDPSPPNAAAFYRMLQQ